MNFSGWVFMITSWSVILGLFSYCMYRTLRNDESQNTGQSGETSENKDTD